MLIGWTRAVITGFMSIVGQELNWFPRPVYKQGHIILAQNNVIFFWHGFTSPYRSLGQGLALRAVEIPINGMNIRFIQQNPNTASEWARRAARGDKVMQVVINDADVQSSDKWIGNVDNGHWNPYKNSHFTSAYATEYKKAA